MYGSTFQSVAQGIEASDMIYLFVCRIRINKVHIVNQKQNMLIHVEDTLLLEKKYRPDGWLGFICGSKLYVDFMKGEFEQVFQKLISQIQFHQRRTSLNSTNKSERFPLTHDTIERVNKSMNCNPILERLLTDNGQHLQNWTHDDLLNFLREKQFDIFRPLFEYEQQFDGHALFILYEQCQSNMESTYRLLNSQLNEINHQNLPYIRLLYVLSVN